MRVRVVLAAIVIAAFWAVAFGANDDNVSALPYDKAAEQTIDGVVLNKVHPLGICQEGLFVTVNEMEMYLGPAEFVRALGLKLAGGERVTIVAAPAAFHEVKIMLARSVTVGEKIFILRDRDGIPKWLQWPFQMDPECTTVPRDQAGLRLPTSR
jgi:hypothetical protein